jgi:Microcystin-dependent protein
MSEIRANSITDAAGTGAPNFPNGLEIAGAAAATVPSGSVMTFAMNTAPTGWLKANGAAVSRTTYANLFSAIGTTFGVGDGSTTFDLPDLRGEFLRGWDDSRGIDSGRAFGSAQVDEFKSHNHSYTSVATLNSGSATRGLTGGTVNQGTTNLSTATGGTETRPRNIALLACIKF